MKKVILKTIYSLGKIFSYLSRLFFIVKYVFRVFYTGYCSRKFNEIGDGCLIDYPFSGGGNIYCGNHFASKPGLRLESISKYGDNSYLPLIKIGDDVKILFRCQISAINEITIGDHVLIGSDVLITDHSHGSISDMSISPNQRKLISKGPVHIGNNVWIGSKVTILPNITIGNNSIIGSNSVITIDIPDNSIAVGNPARIIKTI